MILDEKIKNGDLRIIKSGWVFDYGTSETYYFKGGNFLLILEANCDVAILVKVCKASKCLIQDKICIFSNEWIRTYSNISK